MAETLVFKKHIKNTDLRNRLSVPSRSLRNLPAFEPGKNLVRFSVHDDKGGPPFNFHCYKRKKGYLKPVFTKGWLEFARRNHLSVGDEVTLYKLESLHSLVSYRITVTRKTLRLFGVNITL